MSDSKKSQGTFGFIGDAIGGFFGSIVIIFLVFALLSGADNSLFGGQRDKSEPRKAPWGLAILSIAAVAAGFYWFSPTALSPVSHVQTGVELVTASEAKDQDFCFLGADGTFGRMVGMDADTVVIRSGEGKLHTYKRSDVGTVAC